MSTEPESEQVSFDAPASYQIRIRGRIKRTWSDRFEGMTITVVESESEPVVTVLEGRLLDQAALAGVLNTLYELHLPVLEVRCTGAE